MWRFCVRSWYCTKVAIPSYLSSRLLTAMIPRRLIIVAPLTRDHADRVLTMQHGLEGPCCVALPFGTPWVWCDVDDLQTLSSRAFVAALAAIFW